MEDQGPVRRRRRSGRGAAREGKRNRQNREEETEVAGSTAFPVRGSLETLENGKLLPKSGVFIGQSLGTFGTPQSWGNPWRLEKDAPGERERQGSADLVSPSKSDAGRRVQWRLHALRGRQLWCRCRPGIPCLGDDLRKAYFQEVENIHPSTLALCHRSLEFRCGKWAFF